MAITDVLARVYAVSVYQNDLFKDGDVLGGPSGGPSGEASHGSFAPETARPGSTRMQQQTFDGV